MMQRKKPDDMLLVEIDVNTPPALVVGHSAVLRDVTVQNEQLKHQRADSHSKDIQPFFATAAKQHSNRAFDETIVNIPEAEIHRPSLVARPKVRTSSTTSYMMNTSSETADSVKCVVSTVLFLSVVAWVFIVAIWKNPGM